MIELKICWFVLSFFIAKRNWIITKKIPHKLIENDLCRFLCHNSGKISAHYGWCQVNNFSNSWSKNHKKMNKSICLLKIRKNLADSGLTQLFLDQRTRFVHLCARCVCLTREIIWGWQKLSRNCIAGLTLIVHVFIC